MMLIVIKDWNFVSKHRYAQKLDESQVDGHLSYLYLYLSKVYSNIGLLLSTVDGNPLTELHKCTLPTTYTRGVQSTDSHPQLTAIMFKLSRPKCCRQCVATTDGRARSAR